MGKGHLTVVLDGLGECAGGEATVSRALEPVPGVLRVYVNPVIETAYVVFDPARTGPARLVAALARAGLRVSQQIPG
jgi:Cu2+-exporting ATPase